MGMFNSTSSPRNSTQRQTSMEYSIFSQKRQHLEETSCGRPDKVRRLFSHYLKSFRTWRPTRFVAGIDQHHLVDPDTLADPDSCFSDFNGVNLHHKVCDSDVDRSTDRFPLVLLHGLGASIFSWNKVMKPLSELSGSKVLAFDRPGFGLTSRVVNPNSSNPYSMAYSILSTVFFINYLGSEKIVLVGHSFGGLVALNTYYQVPDRIGALILVDPAIVAPLTSRRIPLQCILKPTARLVAAILRSPFGVMLARIAVNLVGIAIVKFAWHDKGRFSEHTIDGYTKPLKCKGWDRGAVEFLASTMLDLTDQGSKTALRNRLNDISCPVLIITGENDRIVPLWNSKRLSSAIPGSVLEVIKQCGHFPQEEKEQEFIAAVQRFLERLDLRNKEKHV